LYLCPWDNLRHDFLAQNFRSKNREFRKQKRCFQEKQKRTTKFVPLTPESNSGLSSQVVGQGFICISTQLHPVQQRTSRATSCLDTQRTGADFPQLPQLEVCLLPSSGKTVGVWGLFSIYSYY
jgi:hypothetical protein